MKLRTLRIYLEIKWHISLADRPEITHSHAVCRLNIRDRTERDCVFCRELFHLFAEVYLIFWIYFYYSNDKQRALCFMLKYEMRLITLI
jgi:hypothetical protein